MSKKVDHGTDKWRSGDVVKRVIMEFAVILGLA